MKNAGPEPPAGVNGLNTTRKGTENAKGFSVIAPVYGLTLP
ncbi:hypothetical protein [Geobacter sulfurreducens]|jgi:hypothetical protein|nr:hypothetical protein [Geobacter sulfurreducens]HML78493.1 hypothetical protein [Geobacter sulfurreducens]